MYQESTSEERRSERKSNTLKVSSVNFKEQSKEVHLSPKSRRDYIYFLGWGEWPTSLLVLPAEVPTSMVQNRNQLDTKKQSVPG